MRVDRVVLYSTPYDNTYKSVLQMRTVIESIQRPDILSAISFKRSVAPYSYNLTDKALKYINGKIAISINEADVNLLKYNYAILYYNSNPEYFFVTGIESLNSGISPSTLLYLERDVWANNDRYFQELDKPFIFNRGHNYLLYVNPSTNSKVNVSSLNTYPNYTKYHSPSYYINRYEVLWLKMTIDDPNCYTNKESGTDKLYIGGLYKDEGTYPIILQPALVFDRLTESFVDPTELNFKINFTKSGTEWNYARDVNYDLSSIIDSHILKCELTYCVPFRVVFTKSANNEYVSTVSNVSYEMLYTFPDHVQISIFKTVYGSTSADSLYYDYEAITVNAPDYAEYSQPRYMQPADLIVDGVYGSRYPINYKSFYVNGEMIPHVCESKIKRCTIKYYRYRSNPCYVVEYERIDNTITTTRKIPIQNTGSILTASTAYDVYLRNNGNQTISTAIQNILKVTAGAVSIASGSVAGLPAVYSGLKGVISQATNLDDISNRQDSISQPQYDASKAPFYQDLIGYYNSRMDLEKSYLCAYDAHIYGANVPFVDRLRGGSVSNFRYVQIQNPDVPMTCINDKKIIDQILSNGVTIWFYYDGIVNESDALDAISNLDTHISNSIFVPG